ncbi:transketolase [Geobacter pelophilus]|uniref:Transketolase n=1 Tax=Geoanaerobacter pelophilus TaxID=60036 RepID=A0AAW4L6A0_9BACT|nr:transketolase [Geoanaerobacter pelophilus]
MPELASFSRRIRREIIEMAYCSGGPHVGSALSCADILATLYGAELRLDPWHDRDIFILSKAHASISLYAALAARGIMPPEMLATYCQEGGLLPAHLDRQTGYGVECSAGSLGHGFSIGLGMAFGFKRQRSPRRVFIVIGDGECQEGSVWEGALFAPRQGLDNVTVIMDYNNLQAYGRPAEICSFEPIAPKWEAFGWHVCRADGHDHGSLLDALHEESRGKPKIIIARTTKGKGVSFMENELVWHYYIVTQEHRAKALEEIG